MSIEKKDKKYNPQFNKLLQIGIIVRDIESSIKTFEEKFSFGPWETMIMSNEIPVFKEMTINGKKEDFKIKVAMCSCFGMEIELIEPISDGPYKEWLEEHGPGMHHLAFLTRDNYNELLEKHKKETGKEPWIRGECSSVGMDFAYLDLREQLGFIAEIYGMDKSKVPGNDF